MILVIALSLLIGFTLGLLGGGGSILAVPVLVYAAGLGAKEAIATSLLVVGATAVIAVVGHARRGTVDWRIGALFAPAAMAGSYVGGFAAGWFSGHTLLVLFAGTMLVSAVSMFRGRKEVTEQEERELAIHWIIVEGLAVGAFTGLVGAGGGFLVVPALVLLGGVPMHRAVGTSLFVIALKSFTGFAGHASHVSIDYVLAGQVIAAAIAGSFLGAAAAHKVPAQKLRKGFAVFVLVMGVFILSKELIGF